MSRTSGSMESHSLSCNEVPRSCSNPPPPFAAVLQKRRVSQASEAWVQDPNPVYREPMNAPRNSSILRCRGEECRGPIRGYAIAIFCSYCMLLLGSASEDPKSCKRLNLFAAPAPGPAAWGHVQVLHFPSGVVYSRWEILWLSMQKFHHVVLLLVESYS